MFDDVIHHVLDQMTRAKLYERVPITTATTCDESEVKWSLLGVIKREKSTILSIFNGCCAWRWYGLMVHGGVTQLAKTLESMSVRHGSNTKRMYNLCRHGTKWCIIDVITRVFAHCPVIGDTPKNVKGFICENCHQRYIIALLIQNGGVNILTTGTINSVIIMYNVNCDIKFPVNSNRYKEQRYAKIVVWLPMYLPKRLKFVGDYTCDSVVTRCIYCSLNWILCKHRHLVLSLSLFLSLYIYKNCIRHLHINQHQPANQHLVMLKW